MQPLAPTVVLRHRKENLKKCSLRGLENGSGLQFYTYPSDELFPLDSYVLLTLDAEVLRAEDDRYGLFLLDGTWRYAAKMQEVVLKKTTPLLRSLPPGWKTAYPRRQEDCREPTRGLATVEALFAAYCVLGRDTTGLLDHYHWKTPFLELNRELIGASGEALSF